MQLGVGKCIEVIDGVAEVTADIIVLVKSGGAISDWGKYLEISKELIELAKDVGESIPEIADLEAGEVGALVTASWAAAQKIIAAVKA